MASLTRTPALICLSVWGFSCLLALGGCQTARDPLAATPQTNPALLPVGQAGTGPDEFVPARWHLEIDTATLDHELTPVRQGAAQPPQNRSYDFDIDQFLSPSVLNIGAVYRVGDSALQVYFSHNHPFPAPNLTLAPSGTNRADLGYTGRLLLIPGGAPSFYFNDEVRVVEGVIADADGYVNPGNLLANGPVVPFSNTFPYKLLVDEKTDNRPGISNGDIMTGNYDPANGGWQRGNLGPNNTGWTGYDYLHGGQTTSSLFIIRNSALQTPSFSIDLALLIKYTDPRGAADIANRLPPETADVTAFAYRLPYAALDVSQVKVEGFPSIDYYNGAPETINLAVRDWDAEAFTAPTYDLGSIPEVDRIQAGATGPPVGRIAVPALFDGTLPLSLMGSHTGVPNDELIYTVEISNLNEPPGGYVYGLVELVDPEDADPNASLYRYGVDPLTLGASPGRALRRITYQQVQVTVADTPSGAEVPTVVQVEPNFTEFAGTCFGEVTFTATCLGNPYQFYWSFPDGGVEGGPLRFGNSPSETFRLSAPGVYTGYVIASNNEGDSAPFPFPFRVGEAGTLTFTPLVVDSTIDARAISVQQAGVRAQAAVIDGDTGGLYHYRATKNIPVIANDWTRIQLDASTADSNPQLAIHDDKPVVVYRRTNGRTRIALATTATPAAPSDWTFYSFPDSVILHSEVLVTNGRLMFAYVNSGTAQLEVARATLAVPGVDDWIYYPAGNSGVEMLRPRLFAGGFALYLFHHRSDNQILYNITFNMSPREQFDWGTQTVTNNRADQIVQDFYLRDGIPHVTVYEPHQDDQLLYIGKGSFPYYSNDWDIRELSVYAVEYEFSASRLIGERLIAGSGSNNEFFRPNLRMAKRDRDFTPDDLQYQELSETPGDFGSVPIRALTSTGEPKLMVLTANGDGGILQNVLDIPWH